MRLKKISALSLAAAMSVCTVPAFGAAETENVNVPKYIFLFIGDGMSYPQVQTTNYYLNAIADDGDDVLNHVTEDILWDGKTFYELEKALTWIDW